MIPLAISIGLFIAVAGIIVAFGYFYYVRPSRLIQQLSPESTAPQIRSIGVPAKKEGTIVRVIQEIGEKVPASPSDVGDLRKRLIMAGFRNDAALAIFRGVQIVAAGVGLLTGLTLRLGLENMNILFPIILAGLGWMIPSFVLGKIVTKRQERLRLSLPDALDLLVICVEAGMGLDQAIQKVSQDW